MVISVCVVPLESTATNIKPLDLTLEFRQQPKITLDIQHSNEASMTAVRHLVQKGILSKNLLQHSQRFTCGYLWDTSSNLWAAQNNRPVKQKLSVIVYSTEVIGVINLPMYLNGFASLAS